MKKLLIISFFLLGLCLHAQEMQLQPGDLLFYSDAGGMGDAIKESTGCYTHVALVVEVGDTVWIVDASQRYGVSRRPLLHKPSPDVYRLTAAFDTAAVIARATALIGKPYDDAFLPDNDAYYCSELIQVAFDTIFPSKPMNWRDKDGDLLPYWIEHFKKLGVPIPEEVPGTNPTDLSRSPLLRKH